MLQLLLLSFITSTGQTVLLILKVKHSFVIVKNTIYEVAHNEGKIKPCCHVKPKCGNCILEKYFSFTSISLAQCTVEQQQIVVTAHFSSKHAVICTADCVCSSLSCSIYIRNASF